MFFRNVRHALPRLDDLEPFNQPVRVAHSNMVEDTFGILPRPDLIIILRRRDIDIFHVLKEFYDFPRIILLASHGVTATQFESVVRLDGSQYPPGQDRQMESSNLLAHAKSVRK